MYLPRKALSYHVKSALAALMLVASALALAGCRASDPVVVDPAPKADSEATVTPETAALADIEIGLEPVAEGFEQPLYVTGAGDGSGRLFVVEKTGRIWILRDGEKSSAAWLDISDKVSTDSERGLLGLAFAPDFAESGEFYIDYTDTGGNSHVARLTASDPASDDPVSFGVAQDLIGIEQPFSNHNGGMIAFGPDGYLYVGLGDGGSGGDPNGNGQNTASLLGTLLRLDVSQPRDASAIRVRYTIPQDNPFASATEYVEGPRPEIWAWGLRNPWRFSFDRETGDLWIGDVGQNSWEEIDFVPRDGIPGEGYNFGWNVYEATHPFPPDSTPTEGDFTMPIVEYDRNAGQSVTGGYVYRGAAYPELASTYFYGDYSSGRIWGIQRTAGGVENRLLSESRLSVVSFGEDDDGEVYVVDISGGIHRLVQR